MAAFCRATSLALRSRSAAFSPPPLTPIRFSLPDPLPCRTPTPLHCHRFIHVGPIESVPLWSTMASTYDPVLDVDYGHFKLLQSFSVKYAPITIQKWRSERTGLTVVVGSHATPIVSYRLQDLYQVADTTRRSRPAATSPLLPRVGSYQVNSRLMRKVFDDTGRPHTLEQYAYLSNIRRQLIALLFA